jgi:DNA-binding LacI/PurR family transcriptional regulator
MIELQRKSLKPYFLQIREAFRQDIREGRLQAGDALPNERKLAERLRISRMTVRRAYVELAREGLLKRITGRGTFVREAVALKRTVRKGVLAVAAPGDLTTPNSFYYYRLLQGLALASEKAGYPLSFRRCSPQDHGRYVAQLHADKQLRGIICVWLDEFLTVPLKRLKVPVVLLESVQPEVMPLFDEATHDPAQGVYAATRCLLELGHKNIAFLRSAVNRMTNARRVAYERALAEENIPVKPNLIYTVNFDARDAYAQFASVLKKRGKETPTAVICAGDTLSIGVNAAARDAGLRVPEDLSIVGFGDEGYFFKPELSTVRVPIEKMSAIAIDLLVERLKNPRAPLQRVSLPAEFINRETCARPTGR